MPTPQQLEWLKAMKDAATAAGHRWPGAAAAEAADETGWGAHIPGNSNNVLGIKAGRNYIGRTVSANGTEQSANGEISGPQMDHWRCYETPQACFADQTKILNNQRRPDGSLRYQTALNAVEVSAYIRAECFLWSTGLSKGHDVLLIYNAHKDILAP